MVIVGVIGSHAYMRRETVESSAIFRFFKYMAEWPDVTDTKIIIRKGVSKVDNESVFATRSSTDHRSVTLLVHCWAVGLRVCEMCIGWKSWHCEGNN